MIRHNTFLIGNPTIFDRKPHHAPPSLSGEMDDFSVREGGPLTLPWVRRMTFMTGGAGEGSSPAETP